MPSLPELDARPTGARTVGCPRYSEWIIKRADRAMPPALRPLAAIAQPNVLFHRRITFY
jgi:hypothetical protein